jgi:hypothetical protein
VKGPCPSYITLPLPRSQAPRWVCFLIFRRHSETRQPLLQPSINLTSAPPPNLGKQQLTYQHTTTARRATFLPPLTRRILIPAHPTALAKPTMGVTRLKRSTSSTSSQQQQPYVLPEPTPTPTLLPPNDGSSSAARGVLIGLLSAFGSAALVALIFGFIYFLRYTARGRILLDALGRPGEYDDEATRAREEAEALEQMDEIQRAEYWRAKGTPLTRDNEEGEGS